MKSRTLSGMLHTLPTVPVTDAPSSLRTRRLTHTQTHRIWPSGWKQVSHRIFLSLCSSPICKMEILIVSTFVDAMTKSQKKLWYLGCHVKFLSKSLSLISAATGLIFTGPDKQAKQAPASSKSGFYCFKYFFQNKVRCKLTMTAAPRGLSQFMW